MTEAARPRVTRAEIDEIWRRQEADKAEWREVLRRRVAESSAPLSPDLRQELVLLFNSDMRDILRSHRGYRLAGKRDSYRSSLAIMRRSLRSLLDMIASFEAEALTDDSNLMGPLGEKRLDEIVLDIQKELFTCTNAAVSLVDHARRISEAISFPDYDRKRVECFGTDGLHEFVVSLRVLLHHLHVVDAGWQLTADYRNCTKTASFVLSRETLTRINDETVKLSSMAKAYLATQPSSIDLRNVFADYAVRTDRFNDWLTSELQSERIVALLDYDSMLKEKVLRDRRMTYHAMLGNWLNWKQPPNPHEHLSRYLTADQLEVVYRSPRNSREQIDLIISFADRENVVDDHLRERLYELFRRSENLTKNDATFEA